MAAVFTVCCWLDDHFNADLSQSLFVRGTAVHKRLCYDRQAGVDDVRLVDVKHKLRVLDNVHPETQQQTTKQFTSNFVELYIEQLQN